MSDKSFDRGRRESGPLKCPNCHTASPDVVHVALDRGAAPSITTYRCPACRLAWLVEESVEGNPLDQFPPE